MAGIMKSSIVVFMVTMMVATTTMAQTRHVVGGPLGWTIPPTGVNYTTWASQQNFTVGDTLYFNFTTGMHNVAEVAQAAYGPCTTSNPISLTTTGPATINLSAPGNHYYICTVGTHCQIGQKLTINVVAAATAPTTPPPAATPPPATTPTASPPAATPSPSPMSPPTPSPIPSAAPTPATTPAPSPVGDIPSSPPTSDTTPTGSTPPAPNSDTSPPPPSPSAAARSFAAVVPATFLAVALALFY